MPLLPALDGPPLGETTRCRRGPAPARGDEHPPAPAPAREPTARHAGRGVRRPRRGGFRDRARPLRARRPAGARRRGADGDGALSRGGDLLPGRVLAARRAGAGATPGERILDACTGVGGKATQIAELSGNGATVVAVDQDAGRLARLAENAPPSRRRRDRAAPRRPARPGDLRRRTLRRRPARRALQLSRDDPAPPGDQVGQRRPPTRNVSPSCSCACSSEPPTCSARAAASSSAPVRRSPRRARR